MALHPGPRRIVLSITVLLALLLAAGCGDETVGGLAGWWFSDDLKTMHIVEDGQGYRLATDSPLQSAAALEVEDDKLIVQVGKGRLELTPVSDDRLSAKSVQAGEVTEGAYSRGTYADQQSFLTNMVVTAMSDAIVAWGKQHGSYPSITAVRPDGELSKLLQPWPTNPYSGTPAVPGDDPGEYRYRRRGDGFVLRFVTTDGTIGAQASSPPAASP